MSGQEWRRLRGVDQGTLREARLQAHYAAQWLARAARAYVPPRPDDGHTSLGWDDALDGFVTHPAKNGTKLTLQIASLTFAVHGGPSLSLDGRSDAQVRQWLDGELSAHGLDPAALDAPSPYEMPAHALARGALYDAAGSADGLRELAAWYANANLSIGRVRQQMMHGVTSAVCCWPHHFDLAVLTMLAKRGTDADRYLGAGLSPGDNYYDEPYFYVSVYPKPDPAALPTLPMIGHWHTHEFVAAISPAHKIVAQNNQVAAADEFLRHSVALALEILA
ncbi:MAG TPA: hypothetical protein VGF02_03245 [Pseudolabrys sp.]|jgi:hypothetical protein